jgi:aminobenzoyl-glutamate transport protein
MRPYSVVFGVTWTLLMVAWMLLGLPVGPDGPLHYAPAAPR